MLLLACGMGPSYSIEESGGEARHHAPDNNGSNAWSGLM